MTFFFSLIDGICQLDAYTYRILEVGLKSFFCLKIINVIQCMLDFFFFFFFFLNPTFIAKQLLLDSTQIAHLLLNGFRGIFLLYFFGEALVVTLIPQEEVTCLKPILPDMLIT